MKEYLLYVELRHEDGSKGSDVLIHGTRSACFKAREEYVQCISTAGRVLNNRTDIHSVCEQNNRSTQFVASNLGTDVETHATFIVEEA